ncbi:MAG: hypothetical protein ACREX8_07650 [Gammaproteobacteria bacterium]
MSEQQPITDAEADALRKLGYIALGDPSAVLEAYRAGFADAVKPHQPQVFRSGDPEPGPAVGAVLDSKGDVWARKGDAHKGDDCWGVGGDSWTWVLQYGPLVSLPALPDWSAAVKADGRGAAGGAG